jgi:hypothetical protein
MPHRNTHHHSGGKSRSESKSAGDKHASKSGDRARMSAEQPSYDSLDESPTGGSLGKAEHRADTSRMSKKARGFSGASAERSESNDVGPSRGEAAGAYGLSSETAAEQPSRGESWGVSDDSGGALAQDAELHARGESTRASDNEDLTWAGFSRCSPEEANSRGGGAPSSLRSSSASRGESSGRDQEPTAHGGFLEPNERSSGSR